MKNKRNSTMLIIITIAVLLVAIIGATYAYFASSTDADAVINAGVATAKSSAFSSSTSGNIEFNVAFNEMSEAGASNEYIKTDNATLSVDLSSEDERATTICNYDVVWAWDSTDRYTQSDVDLPYTHNDIEYPYEFSVQVGTDVEKDLSSLDWNEEGTAIISSKTIEVAPKGSKHEDYDVVVRMYNIPVNQEKLFNKSFKAHIKVDNLNCISVTDTKLAYYVISGGTETKVDTVPKGDYKLNTERTTCKRGGTISGYNSITGELTSTIPIGDECDIYFDELPRIVASGTDVASNYDGTNKQISVSVSDITDYQVYYSLDKALTRENYTEGSTTHPEVKERGTTKVYWCAVKEGYATYCSSNDIVIGDGIITGTVSDYTGTYDGDSHTLEVEITSPSNVTMYYSTSTPLTKDNYSTEGKTQPEERTNAGTTIVYWCATADKYTPLCGSNKITVNPASMNASGSNYTGTYDGNPHSITVTKPADATVYYSTSIALTKDNYKSGTTTNPARTDAGTTTVYWCAVKDNYNPVCSNNNITINKDTMIASGTNYSGEGSGSISVTVTKPSTGSTIYYSTTTQLNSNNYSASGSTTNPRITKTGTTTVYWCAVANNYNPVCSSNNIKIDYPSLATYITTNVYNSSENQDNIKNNAAGVYYHNASLTNGAADNTYRYAGADADVNNYVCFEGACTENDLYRIISVDSNNQIKVIKATSLGNMAWNSAGTNTWKGSSLETYLNGTYLTSLGEKANKIETTTWSVGGASSANDLQKKNVKDFMAVELNNSVTYSAKIGLMYASEYGYAALPEVWTKELYNYEPSKEKNWMLTSASYEWTISRTSDRSYLAFLVDSGGYVGNFDGVTGTYAVRPSFSLNSSVKITNAGAEGVGTKANPMIIN